MMRDERATEVWEMVRKSREEGGGDGVEVWRVGEHEGWLDVGGVVKGEEEAGEEKETGGMAEEEREKVVEAFRREHGGWEVEVGVEGVTVSSSLIKRGDGERC